MADSYDSSGWPDYPDLDEYLTEYVDGRMEPEVAAVFEELLRKDPQLAERVRQLKAIRQTLNTLHNRCKAPCGFERRLRQQLAIEYMRETVSPIHLRMEYPHVWISASLLVLLLSGLVLLQLHMQQPHVEASQDTALPTIDLIEEAALRPVESRLAATPTFSWERVPLSFIQTSSGLSKSSMENSSNYSIVPPERVDSLRRLFYTAHTTVISP